eukprot:tig00000789_g4120.t1
MWAGFVLLGLPSSRPASGVQSHAVSKLRSAFRGDRLRPAGRNDLRGLLSERHLGARRVHVFEFSEYTWFCVVEETSAERNFADGWRDAAIRLREYQIEAVNRVTQHLERGKRRQLIALPTGTGKTVIFAALARSFGVKTLVIAHRKELIDQAVERFRLVWPGAEVGVCMADRDEIDKQIVVASIQTAMRDDRIAALREQNFELCIVDEAHHAVANSYVRLLRGLGFVDESARVDGEEEEDEEWAGPTPSPPTSGAPSPAAPARRRPAPTAASAAACSSASPPRVRPRGARRREGSRLRLGAAFRHDDKRLLSLFDDVVFQRSIVDMIRSEYLVDLRSWRAQTGSDLSLVALDFGSGDFNERSLATAVNNAARNALIVDTYTKHAAGKQAVAFCASIEHARSLAEAFQAAGIAADAIYGSMRAKERDEAIRRFRSNEIQVLTNYQILTEGFDHPAIEAIIMARPTRSVGLYTQMVGRGTRKYPNKQECVVLEFFDHGFEEGVCHLGKLIGDIFMKDGESLLEAMARGGDDTALLHKRLLSNSQLHWHQRHGSYRIYLAELGTLCIEPWDPPALAAADDEDEGEDEEEEEEEEEEEAAVEVAAAIGKRREAGRVRRVEGAEADGPEKELVEWEREDALAAFERSVMGPAEGQNFFVVLRKPSGRCWKVLQGYPVPLEYAESIAEDFLRHPSIERKLSYAIDKGARWRNQRPTPSQLSRLASLGYIPPRGVSRGRVSDLIAHATFESNMHRIRHMEPAPEQIAALLEHGLRRPSSRSKAEALLSKIEELQGEGKLEAALARLQEKGSPREEEDDEYYEAAGPDEDGAEGAARAPAELEPIVGEQAEAAYLRKLGVRVPAAAERRAALVAKLRLLERRGALDAALERLRGGKPAATPAAEAAEEGPAPVEAGPSEEAEAEEEEERVRRPPARASVRRRQASLPATHELHVREPEPEAEPAKAPAKRVRASMREAFSNAGGGGSLTYMAPELDEALGSAKVPSATQEAALYLRSLGLEPPSAPHKAVALAAKLRRMEEAGKLKLALARLRETGAASGSALDPLEKPTHNRRGEPQRRVRFPERPRADFEAPRPGARPPPAIAAPPPPPPPQEQEQRQEETGGEEPEDDVAYLRKLGVRVPAAAERRAALVAKLRLLERRGALDAALERLRGGKSTTPSPPPTPSPGPSPPPPVPSSSAQPPAPGEEGPARAERGRRPGVELQLTTLDNAPEEDEEEDAEASMEVVIGAGAPAAASAAVAAVRASAAARVAASTLDNSAPPTLFDAADARRAAGAGVRAGDGAGGGGGVGEAGRGRPASFGRRGGQTEEEVPAAAKDAEGGLSYLMRLGVPVPSTFHQTEALAAHLRALEASDPAKFRSTVTKLLPPEDPPEEPLADGRASRLPPAVEGEAAIVPDPGEETSGPSADREYLRSLGLRLPASTPPEKMASLAAKLRSFDRVGKLEIVLAEIRKRSWEPS